jgi:preprotein translocase subunit YajC
MPRASAEATAPNDAKIARFFSGIGLVAAATTPEEHMFVNEAWAQAGAGGAGGGFESILLIGAMFAVMYFLMIRPQMKRAKEHKTMVEALQKGDEVVTSGGVLGRISKVGEGYVSVEIAPNVEIQVQRAAVQTVLPKGTLKNT